MPSTDPDLITSAADRRAPTWTLDVDDTFDLAEGPSSRWCSLRRPGGFFLPVSVEGPASEWLELATAIAERRPLAFKRAAFAPTESGGGDFHSPKNAASERPSATLTAAELDDLLRSIRDQLEPPAAVPPITTIAEADAALATLRDSDAPARDRLAAAEALLAAGGFAPVPIDAAAPPDHVIEAARLAGALSPCGKSKRGAAIFDRQTGEVTSRACNHLPGGIACAGDDACRAACNRRCVHAETAAIVDAHREGIPGCEIVHVKVVDGGVVTSGPPSCVPCAAMILRAGLDAAWLLHEDGWRRYPADEFYRLSCLAPAKSSPPADDSGSGLLAAARDARAELAARGVRIDAAAILAEDAAAEREWRVETPEATAAPTFDLNGDVNGPACGCEPGKLDPECHHGVEMEDLARRVARLTMGPLPFDEVAAGVRELLEAAGKLPRATVDRTRIAKVLWNRGAPKHQTSWNELGAEQREHWLCLADAAIGGMRGFIADGAEQLAAALAEQLRGFASALDSTEATVARHVAGRLRVMADRAAAPAPLDVVTAMRDPRFKTRRIVVEYREAYPGNPESEDGDAPVLGELVYQLRAVVDEGVTYAERRSWSKHAGRWWMWKAHGAGGESVDELFLPCRIVPYADANAAPADRGELPTPIAAAG